MSKIISVYSFRDGAGKTSLIANLAVLLASEGRRVAVIDTVLDTPALHSYFGFDVGAEDRAFPRTFHSYLTGECDLWHAAYPVSLRALPLAGSLYLIPSRPTPPQRATIQRDGYDPLPIDHDLRALAERLNLDAVLLDIDAGINTGTLALVALSDTLMIILRHDKRDYQGTGVMVDVARQLAIPRVLLIANEVPATFDPADFERQAEETYRCEVAAIVPHSDLLQLGGSTFALQHAADPAAIALRGALPYLLP